MHITKSESVGSQAQASCGIGRQSFVTEQAEAKGSYVATCVGPVESRRAEYVALQGRLARKGIVGFADRAFFGKKLKAAVAAIPMEEKWSDKFDNLVTTVGKNNLLDNHLSGSGYTASWYLGLISSTSYTSGAAIGDTSASHTGWTEDQAYSQANRPTATFSAAAAGSKALTAALAFSINGTTTIKGCFLISNSTKGGTTGTLYSAGLFSGGDKAVGNGDTLNVSYTASA